MSPDGPTREQLQGTVTHWLVTAASVAFFSTVLYYCYKLRVAPLFAYQGLTYRAPELFPYGVALGVTILLAINLPRRIVQPTDFILWMLFLLVGAPSILIPQYMMAISVAEATKLGLVVAGCLLMVTFLVRHGPRSREGFGTIIIDPKYVWLGVAVFTVGIYAYLLLTVGFTPRFLSFADVYSVRSEFAEETATAVGLGYLLPIQFNIINPLLITRGWFAGHRSVLLAGILGQVFIYTVTGQKAVVLSTVALLALAVMFRRDPQMRGVKLLTFAAVAALATLVIDYVLSSYVWSSLFVRRFLIIPGALTAAYVQVFQNRPRNNFAGSPLVWLDSQYLSPPSQLVGELFAGDATTNANVSLFGHGYLNMGYTGMVIESLVLVLMLWAVTLVTRGLPTPVVAMLFFMLAIALSSASVFTTILTHGFLAALVLCAALPRDGWTRTVRTSPEQSVTAVRR